MRPVNIAVDGPSGVGKSSVCQKLAEEFQLSYLDTGGMYRAIALGMDELGIPPVSSDELKAALPHLAVEQKGTRIYLNSSDVSDKIRTSRISALASQYAGLPEVRAALVAVQQKIASETSCILDGRDIGTVVLPDADVKLYLTASSKARAERRYLQDKEAGRPADLAQIQKEIEERDYRDTHRAISPLHAAEDAIIVDTSDIDKEQTIALCSRLVKEKLQKGTL